MEVKNLTIDGIKKLAGDTNLLKLVAQCLAEKAKAELIRERVNAYIRPVFNKYHFVVGPTVGGRRGTAGERITDESKLYLCEDEEMCKQYYQDCHEAHLNHEFADMIRGKEAGYCPALIAESNHMKAKSAMRMYGEKFFGFEINTLEHMKKFEDMLISMVIEKYGKQTIHNYSMCEAFTK